MATATAEAAFSSWLAAHGLSDLKAPLAPSAVTLEALLVRLEHAGRADFLKWLNSLGIGPQGVRQRLANAAAKQQRAELQGYPQCVCVSLADVPEALLPSEQRASAVLDCMSKELTAVLSHTDRFRVAALNLPGSALVESATEPPPLPPAHIAELLCARARAAPLVSCVSPTSGGRHWCHARLYESFACQTYEPRELIVLDDGAAPSPFFSSLADERVTYVHRGKHVDEAVAADASDADDGSNRRLRASSSLGAKRNSLSEMARGELIAHMDDDDVYLPVYLERMVTALLACRADLVQLANFHHLDAVDDRLFFYSAERDAKAPASHSRKWGYGFAFLYRASLAARVRFRPIDHGEDYARTAYSLTYLLT
jgi:hypothetical protein